MSGHASQRERPREERRDAVRCFLLSPKTTVGSHAFVLRAEEACEMVVCPERYVKNSFISRLPPSPWPQSSRSCSKSSKIASKREKLAIRVEHGASIFSFKTARVGCCGARAVLRHGWPERTSLFCYAKP